MNQIDRILHAMGDGILAVASPGTAVMGTQHHAAGTAERLPDIVTSPETCKAMNLNYKVGNVVSSDLFYRENPNTKGWIKMGVLAVEMEIAALYMNAARSGNKALGILTVSDHIITGESTTAEQRQTTFTNMMEVALSLI